MEIWNLTIPAIGRHPLFPTEEARRRAVHALARVAGGSLALFCIVDEHIHLVAVCSRIEAGRLARAVGIALGHRAATRTGPAHFRQVRERRHLETLVGYVLGQPAHHGLPGHPALWTGSACLDLLGARVIPGLDLRLREVLPRLDSRRILEAVGLVGIDLRPMSLEEIRKGGAFALAAAAGAALAARPDLHGNEDPTVAARVATATLANAAGIPTSEVAAALGIWPRSARRLAGRQSPARVLSAVRRRLTLEGWVERARPP